MSDSGAIVVVSTTVGTEAEAEALAERLVNERLAACVQHMPIRSMYRWQGQVESASEFLVLAKTRADLAETVVAGIRALHTYELPEILVTAVDGGLPAYLAWVAGETGVGSDG